MSRLEELTHKVDAFFARVAERHGDAMQCNTGCADCCHVRLTVTAVEAAAIRVLVETWPVGRRRGLALAPSPAGQHTTFAHDMSDHRHRAIDDPRHDSALAGAVASPADRCAALDSADRCKIYDARPVVCRSHGVPVRLRRGGLPVIESCHRNFIGTPPDADCVLDQTTLSAMVFAIDAAERATTAGDARVDLAGLLAELAAI